MGDNKDLVKNFKEFMAFCQDQIPDDLDLRLKALGFDPDKIGKMGKALAEELYLTKMNELRQKIKQERMAAQAAAAAFLKRFAMESVEKVNEAVQEIRQGKLGADAQRYAQAYFRSFEKATFEDKVSLLKDIELLKHLSQEK